MEKRCRYRAVSRALSWLKGACGAREEEARMDVGAGTGEEGARSAGACAGVRLCLGERGRERCLGFLVGIGM